MEGQEDEDPTLGVACVGGSGGSTGMANEQPANEGFDANILHAPGDEHIVSNEGSSASILQAPIEGFSV